MRIARGVRFVLPGTGVVTVREVYVGIDPETGVPDEFIELLTPRGIQKDYPEEAARRRGRPIMSRGEARQVLSILANRFAPVTPMQAKMRYRKAQKVLGEHKPIEMAKVLRELLMRAQGLGDAPINIPLQEASLRSVLIRTICDELKEVLNFQDEGFSDGDCELAINSMSQRINPAPPKSEVARYRAVYSGYPTTGVSAELRTIARAVKQKSTSDDAKRRADLNARQFALLHVVDERSRRSSR